MASTVPLPHTGIRYVIGIDGGGSGTRARLTSRDGATLGVGEAGPSALAQGLEQARANIIRAIDNAFNAANVALVDERECAVGIGLSGANFSIYRDPFRPTLPQFGQLVLDTDAYTTLLGAHGGRPGAIVAAGTGSVGEAQREDGTRVRAGGWGFPVGDEGSGAWLGLRAMLHAQHAMDGMERAGALARAVWDFAGSSREILLDWCGAAGQHEYATLAPLVFDTERIDGAAAALVADAVTALEAIAAALDPDGALPLVVAGSIGQRLQPRMTAAIRARCVAAAGDAVDGAVLLVRNALESVTRPV